MMSTFSSCGTIFLYCFVLSIFPSLFNISDISVLRCGCVEVCTWSQCNFGRSLLNLVVPSEFKKALQLSFVYPMFLYYDYGIERCISTLNYWCACMAIYCFEI